MHSLQPPSPRYLSIMASAPQDSENGSSISLPARPRPPPSNMKERRVLACTHCQHRKIKCDRNFPNCSNCVKNGVQCVPANLVPKQRKRRFAERELLDRLRHYEGLLKTNRIDFEPLHPSSTATKEQPSPTVAGPKDDQNDIESTTAPETTPTPSV